MRHAFALILSVWLATLAVRADRDQELTVYFFWVGDCPYCALAHTFLDNLWIEDPGVQFRDFEVENSLANAILFSRVYERIGMSDLGAVPLIVVGPHVYVGFDNESGREILQQIKECRKRGCRDIVRDLIRVPSDLDQAAAYFIPPATRTGKSSVLSVSK
jgi:hypothetical protein